MATFQQQIEFYKDPAARATLVPSTNPQAYNLQNCTVRQEVMCWVKELALKEGFKTIVPFNDRMNKMFTCISMNCCLCCNLSSRKSQINCPWRLTFLKLHHEQVYRIVGYPQTFLNHNHPLPIEGLATLGDDDVYEGDHQIN